MEGGEGQGLGVRQHRLPHGAVQKSRAASQRRSSSPVPLSGGPAGWLHFSL
jgi:hypothetical protein